MTSSHFDHPYCFQTGGDSIENSDPTIRDIPVEILIDHMICYLPIEDIFNFSLVVRGIWDSNKTWRNLCKRDDYETHVTSPTNKKFGLEKEIYIAEQKKFGIRYQIVNGKRVWKPIVGNHASIAGWCSADVEVLKTFVEDGIVVGGEVGNQHTKQRIWTMYYMDSYWRTDNTMMWENFYPTRWYQFHK